MKLIRALIWAGLVFFAVVFYAANQPAKKISADNTAESRFGMIGNTIDQAAETYAYWDKVALPWQAVEGAPHAYSFAKLDAQLAKKGPIHLVGLLEANAPAHIACRRFVGIGGSCPPVNMNDYAEYVGKTVAHFKGRIEVWQIEDGVYSGVNFGGSLDDYTVMLNTATTVIKYIDPAAKVMVASHTLALVNREYFDWLAQADSAYDLIDFHVNGEWREIAQEMSNARSQLEEHGISKPVWVTELRGKPDKYEDLIKKHIVLLSQGVEKIFWYDELNTLAREPYRLLASLLYNYSISKKIDARYQLDGGAFRITSFQYLLVVWSNPQKTINIKKEFGGGAIVFDLFGRKLAVSDAMVIGASPIYIVTRSYTPSDEHGGIVNSLPVRIVLTPSVTQPIKVGEQLTVSVDVTVIGAPIRQAGVHIVFPADLVRLIRVDHSHSGFQTIEGERTDNTSGIVDITKSGSLGRAPTERIVDLVFEAIGRGAGTIEPEDQGDIRNVFMNTLGSVASGTSSRVAITIE
ncbi:hypothetical protein HY065_02870 [Candidatus Berkelbacteria bacterium]|nr:hypothetical protein [Candidatus Berkelbacteria bacterium]